MGNANELVIYLSEDKQHLENHQGIVIYRLVESGGTEFYASVGIESEAYARRCINHKMKKVCTLWNADHDCLAWGVAEVCTQWEYFPAGFNNIS